MCRHVLWLSGPLFCSHIITHRSMILCWGLAWLSIIELLFAKTTVSFLLHTCRMLFFSITGTRYSHRFLSESYVIETHSKKATKLVLRFLGLALCIPLIFPVFFSHSSPRLLYLFVFSGYQHCSWAPPQVVNLPWYWLHTILRSTFVLYARFVFAILSEVRDQTNYSISCQHVSSGLPVW